MKVIIAGCRTVKNKSFIYQAVNKANFDITEVVSGGANGVDSLGEVWAKENGIPFERFSPDWSKGKVGALNRNMKMAEYADALIAIWDRYSSGTANMIANAYVEGLEICIFKI